MVDVFIGVLFVSLLVFSCWCSAHSFSVGSPAWGVVFGLCGLGAATSLKLLVGLEEATNILFFVCGVGFMGYGGFELLRTWRLGSFLYSLAWASLISIMGLLTVPIALGWLR